MPITYINPIAARRPPQVVDPTDLGGEDISLRGGDLGISGHGDWATLSGAPAARQSVEREACASPGDMPRRPDWGMGLRDSLMRGASRDVRDRQASAVRARLNVNPRIDRVETVDVAYRDDLAVNGVPGVTTVTIGAFVKGQRISFTAQVLPRRGG
jgi:phage baseplate assembly protein W